MCVLVVFGLARDRGVLCSGGARPMRCSNRKNRGLCGRVWWCDLQRGPRRDLLCGGRGRGRSTICVGATCIGVCGSRMDRLPQSNRKRSWGVVPMILKQLPVCPRHGFVRSCAGLTALPGHPFVLFPAACALRSSARSARSSTVMPDTPCLSPALRVASLYGSVSL